jgi:hypothetical protein
MLTHQEAAAHAAEEDQRWRALHEEAIDLAIEDARGANGHAEMMTARTWILDPGSRFSTLHCRLLGMDPARARLMVRRRLEAQRRPKALADYLRRRRPRD